MQNNKTRITIMIDEDIQAKIRELQANLIESQDKYYSYSKVLNMVLLAGLLASEKLNRDDWIFLRSYDRNNKLNQGKIFENYLENLNKIPDYL
ncbi:MAG: hypothetical protein GWO15_09460 [Nitrosopumilaceae archaeon]|nr:hypothetical protein [Nitrosopumilaceae archaeon]